MFALRTKSALALLLLILPSLRAAAGELEITADPESGPLDTVFTITLTNHTGQPQVYVNCSTPVIVSLADGSSVYCADPVIPGQCNKAILQDGDSLQVGWNPLEKACPGTPAPAIYEVRWDGQSDARPARIEITPDPDHELLMSVDPTEARMGETVHVTVENTTDKTLTYNKCCVGPGVIDPRGLGTLCRICPACILKGELVPGDSLTYDWTPGTSVCDGTGGLPGPHRIVWGGFKDDDPDSVQQYYGETTVLVLPAEASHLDLALASGEVPLGQTLGITATNPLAVSVWRAPCCDQPILIDALGRTSPCSACPLYCAPSRSEEVLPGGTVSIDVVLPGAGDCGLEAGTWSVIWGPNFALIQGGDPAPPVYGYSTVIVDAEDNRPRFVRGNCDGAGDVDLTDVIALLGYLYQGEEAPACLDACDADDTSQLELTDAVVILGFLYLGTAVIQPPYPAAGVDPTPDLLGCKG